MLTDGTTIPIRRRPAGTPTVVRTREKLEVEPALSRKNTIRVSRRIVLPPQSETNVQAVCSHTGPVVLESKPQLYEKRQVSLTNGFIDVQKDVSCTIRVANFSAHERTLAKNQVLRYAKPAPETIFKVDLPENVKPSASSAVYTSEVATSDSEKPPGSEPLEASLSGSSFRNELLELPVPEGVKARVKEPEPLPSLSEIDLSDLYKDTQRRLRHMISAYVDMWDGTLGEIEDARNHITPREAAKPSRINPYRAGTWGRAEIRKAITEMKEDGVIRDAKSEWASPVVVIPKPHGTMRFCVDYRRLNELKSRTRIPSPVWRIVWTAWAKPSTSQP